MSDINTCENCESPHDLIECGFCRSKTCLDCVLEGFSHSRQENVKICTSCFNAFISEEKPKHNPDGEKPKHNPEDDLFIVYF